MYDVCFYHKDCYDGFTSAWVVNAYFPGIKLVPVAYGDNVEVSSVDDKHVLIVDFSFPGQTLLDMVRVGAKTVTVLDHHKTAQVALAEFSANDMVFTPQEYLEKCIAEKKIPIRAWFDMEQSGAQLALRALLLQFGVIKSPRAPNDNARWLVDYVADRDLWKHELPFSKEVNAYINSYDFDLTTWDHLHGALMHGAAMESKVVVEGNAILRVLELQAKRIAAGDGQRMMIGGYWVTVVNCSGMFASDVGHILAKEAFPGDVPLGATYVDGLTGRKFSLRSFGDTDVSAIAKAYSEQFGTTGGGHKNAAGFLAPHGWEGDR